MPSIHAIAHSAAHSSSHGIHYEDPSHSSGAKPEGRREGGHVPLVVKPEPNPFPPSASGLPTSSMPMKSSLQKVASPDKSEGYLINTKDIPDANGSRPVYRRDADTGAPQATHERAIADGQGGWKIASKADSAKQASAPALPPAAKIDPKQLGPLNKDGVYPGKDGNCYVRIGNGYHQVSYDKQLQGWKTVDPDKPNDFSKSVPVKLDGKGGAEPLTKPKLEGGNDTRQELTTRLHALHIAEDKLSDELRPLNRDLNALEAEMNKSKYVSTEQLYRQHDLTGKIDSKYHDRENIRIAIRGTERQLHRLPFEASPSKTS